MKKIIFLLVAVMPLLALGQKAKIEFKSTSYNFGTINENDGEASCEFRFKNTGSAPLILTNVRAGCGCTTPQWDRQPVAPGDSGVIRVAYNPRNRPGAFVKSITVNSNATNAVASLTIRGNVIRKPANPLANYRFAVGPVRMTVNNINLGEIKNNQVIEKSVEIYNSGEEPAKVEVTSGVPYITTSVNHPLLHKGQKGIILIKYEAPKRNDWGFVTDQVHVKVNDNTLENIGITATITEDFSHYAGNFEKAPVATFSEDQVSFEGLPKNSTKTHEFYIQNTGKSDLILRKLKTSDDHISINVAKYAIKPGKKVKATVTFKTDSNPKTVKLIQFTLNDPQQPIVTYKVTATTK